MKLLAMLNEAEQCGFGDVVSWLPDGRAFKIHDEEKIADILPRYFKQTRYKSFVRQLQIYSFERTFRGPRKGECKHPLFFRGQTEAVILNRPIEDFQRKDISKERRSKSKSKSVVVSSKSKQQQQQQNRSPTSLCRSVSIGDEDKGKTHGRPLVLVRAKHHRRPSIGEIALEITDLGETSVMTTAAFVDEEDEDEDCTVGVGVFDPLPYNNSTKEEHYQQELKVEVMMKSFIEDGGFDSILMEALDHDEEEIGYVSDNDRDSYDHALKHRMSFSSSFSDDGSSNDSFLSTSSIRKADLISDEFMDDLLLDLA